MAKKEQKTDSGTVVKSCSCRSDYQDKRYGVGQRVHNIGTKGSTCTVCGVRKT